MSGFIKDVVCIMSVTVVQTILSSLPRGLKVAAVLQMFASHLKANITEL